MSLTLEEGSTSVVLPNPDFGDEDTIDFNMNITRNRAGEPLITRDTDWPIYNISQYEFSNLSDSLVDELNAFLIAKAGLSITLTDHDGIIKTGIILSPEIETVTRGQGCRKYVGFRFLEDIS